MRNGIVSPGSSRQTAFRAALSVTALAAMVVAIPVVLFSVGGAPLSISDWGMSPACSTSAARIPRISSLTGWNGLP